MTKIIFAAPTTFQPAHSTAFLIKDRRLMERVTKLKESAYNLLSRGISQIDVYFDMVYLFLFKRGHSIKYFNQEKNWEYLHVKRYGTSCYQKSNRLFHKHCAKKFFFSIWRIHLKKAIKRINWSIMETENDFNYLKISFNDCILGLICKNRMKWADNVFVACHSSSLSISLF